VVKAASISWLVLALRTWRWSRFDRRGDRWSSYDRRDRGVSLGFGGFRVHLGDGKPKFGIDL
jgi:hypothetical protein